MLATGFCTHVDIYCFIFFSVKMYFQMLSHLVTLANKGVKTISYWNWPLSLWPLIPSSSVPGGERISTKTNRKVASQVASILVFLVKPFVPDRKIGITGVIIWHQPKQMHTHALSFGGKSFKIRLKWLIAPQMGNWMNPQCPDLSSRFA